MQVNALRQRGFYGDCCFSVDLSQRFGCLKNMCYNEQIIRFIDDWIKGGICMCLICDRIQMIKDETNPFFVKELETGYVVFGDTQRIEGYTLFLCKKFLHTYYSFISKT